MKILITGHMREIYLMNIFVNMYKQNSMNQFSRHGQTISAIENVGTQHPRQQPGNNGFWGKVLEELLSHPSLARNLLAYQARILYSCSSSYRIFSYATGAFMECSE